MSSDVVGKYVQWFCTIIGFIFISLFFSSGANQLTQTSFVQSNVSDFVNTVKNTGRITIEDYIDLSLDLASIGIATKIEIEHSHKSVDPVYDSTGNFTGVTKTNTNMYYTEQILEELNSSGIYRMTKGDTINMTVYNTEPTLYSRVKSIFNQGNSTVDIVVFDGGRILDETK